MNDGSECLPFACAACVPDGWKGDEKGKGDDDDVDEAERAHVSFWDALLLSVLIRFAGG